MATGWNVLDALNKKSAAAMTDNKPKARFRTKDINIKQIYSNDKNFYSMPDIEQLAQHIYAVGLLENLTVMHAPCDRGEYRLISGERRWRALSLLVEQGHKEFEVVSCQIKTPAEENEETIQMIIANSYRNKTIKDVLEEEQELKARLKDMKKRGQTLQGYKLDEGRLRDVIAKMLQVSSAKVAQIENINKNLITEFTEELKEEKMTFSAAYEISTMEKGEQEKLLERYQENGLTWKEVKEIKKEQEEKKKQQEEMPENHEEPAKELTGGLIKEEKDIEEWQDPHPIGITSLCYGCKRYMECNVKTSTCKSCDRYINKAEAEKTEEQRYNEEQDRIDKETKKILQERQQEEEMKKPSAEHLQEPETYTIKMYYKNFEDAKKAVRNFEIRKDEGYKKGDILKIYEVKNGKQTGRILERKIIYVQKECEGLKADYCAIGCVTIHYTEEEVQKNEEQDRL